MKKLVENKQYELSEFKFESRDRFFAECQKEGIVEYIDRSTIKFNFVGLLYFRDILIYIFPKYYGQAHIDELTHVDSIFYTRVLHKSAQDFALSGNEYQKNIIKEDNIITIYRELLNYHVSYRYYNPVREKRSVLFEHKINWSRTIEQEQPLIVEDDIIYISAFSEVSANTPNHIITDLHKFATFEAFETIGKFIYPYLSIDQQSDNPLDYYQRDFLVSLLKSELNNTFVDNEVYLLNLLLDYLSKKSDSSSAEVKMFGTRSFYHVWENACKMVTGDQYHELQKLIPDLIWNHKERNYIRKDPLIPDILIETENKFLILDAKYYLPEFQGTRVRGVPGMESISKQIVYELVLSDKTDKSIINAFLFPRYQSASESKYFKVLDNGLYAGTVKLNGVELPEISYYFLPEKEVFHSYLNNKKCSLDL